MTFKEVVKVLESNGWAEVRVKSSHHQFKKPGVEFLATVPNHGSKDISIGVIKSLEKGTGLSFI